MFESGLISVNGTRLFCRVEGGEPGLPWLVFGNSLMTDHTIWDSQLPPLQENYRVLRYDTRGHGGSDLPDVPMTMEILAADLIGILDALEISNCGFVGLSLGVPTALTAYRMHPERFERLVLSDGQIHSPLTAVEFWDERIELASAEGMDVLAERTVVRWLTPDATLQQSDRLRRMIADTPLDGFIYCAEALKAFDCTEALAKITCPVQLIAGAQDGAMPDNLRSSMDCIADARMTVIDRAGHVPNFERPEAFNAVLRSFLLS